MDISLIDVAMGPAAVVAAVKAARTTFPKIDGLLVLLFAGAFGFGLSYLFGDEPTIKATALQGLMWGLAGSGYMTIADRIAPSIEIHHGEGVHVAEIAEPSKS